MSINTNKEYELWRIDSLLTLLNFYQNQSCNKRLVSDWLDPYLDMKCFIDNKQNYYDFWLNKAELNNMKIQWIRWAIKFVQQFKKIKCSNPFDELHVSYLVGVQYFVTADKPLYDCLKRIKQDKIIDFAEPILIQVKDSDIMCQLKDKLNFPF